MTKEIDIVDDLLPRHVGAFDTMRVLGAKYPPSRWVLVGGMMVMLLGREFGARSARAEGTKDADVLVDIVADSMILTDVVNHLTTSGYEIQDMPGDADQTARCTFVTSSVQIDVLCPDDTPPEQLVVAEKGVASIAIPGGRRALETARLVSVYYSDERPNADLYLPTMAGGLVAKAASAVDERTASSPRHLQDVAFLMSAPFDPEEVRRELGDQDLMLLEQIRSPLLDSGSVAWTNLDASQRQAAQAAYDFMVS